MMATIASYHTRSAALKPALGTFPSSHMTGTVNPTTLAACSSAARSCANCCNQIL